HFAAQPTRAHPPTLHDALPISGLQNDIGKAFSITRQHQNIGQLKSRTDIRHESGCMNAWMLGDDVLLIVVDGRSGVETAHDQQVDRKSTRLNSSHVKISYAVFG